MIKNYVAAVLAALVLLAPASRAEEPTANLAPEIAGARFGQAQSAAKVCPGGIVTDKAHTLERQFAGAALETFNSHKQKIVAAWDDAFSCQDWDPETRRPTQCRVLKLQSCREAWREIGPDGTEAPGLLGFEVKD